MAKIRIIGGLWRGRKLPVANEEGLRPSGDRLRETLFNWLAPHLPGARVLDCYAGSGALGLEALSRGARYCDFIEFNTGVAQLLRDNISLLEAEANICHGDFLHWTAAADTPPFDLVFIDPPFTDKLWQASIEHVQSHIELGPEAVIYLESPKNQALRVPQNWQLSKDKIIGQIRASLYQYSAMQAQS